MAAVIRCPACGVRGVIGDEITFEPRGKANGRAVQKCLECGAGLFVTTVLKRTEVIPDDLWIRMQERFDEDMAEPVQPDYPQVRQALETLWQETQANAPASLIVVSSAAHDVAAAVVEHVSGDHVEYANLDVGMVRSMIACGGSFYVMVAAAQHDDLRAFWAEEFDVPDNRDVVPIAVVATYADVFLTADQKALAGEMLNAYSIREHDRVDLLLGRLMVTAADPEAEPSIADALLWRTELRSQVEAFAGHLWDEVERFAAEAEGD